MANKKNNDFDDSGEKTKGKTTKKMDKQHKLNMEWGNPKRLGWWASYSVWQSEMGRGSFDGKDPRWIVKLEKKMFELEI